MTNYTDLERKQIAEQEYNKKLKVGKEITINRGAKTIGTIREVIADETDFHVIVYDMVRDENFDLTGYHRRIR